MYLHTASRVLVKSKPKTSRSNGTNLHGSSHACCILRLQWLLPDCALLLACPPFGSSPPCLRLLSCPCPLSLAPREWSRVPEAEKSYVRLNVLQLMLSDSSDRVALQLGLLASNICAFDFPSRWVCGCVETWSEGTDSNTRREANLPHAVCLVYGGGGLSAGWTVFVFLLLG